MFLFIRTKPYPVFLVDVVDGQILVTDCDMQQAAWDQFIEEDDKT